MSDNTSPERSDEHGGELNPLDEALLATSRMRMIGEEASDMAPGMTEDVFGHAGVAAMVQEFTQRLGAVTTEIADRMEQNLGSVAESQRSEREGGSSDHG